jgi:hypothetical protein
MAGLLEVYKRKIMTSIANNKEKVGVVPKEQISGSDADRAYDKDGNFVNESEAGDTGSEGSGIPDGSDADTDE